jgi:hypothetical protein
MKKVKSVYPEAQLKDKLVSAGSSYLRAAVAAVVALYMAGQTEPEVLVNAFIAGFAGPAIKFLDPKSKDFGLKSK